MGAQFPNMTTERGGMCTAAVGSYLYAIGGTGAKSDSSQHAGEILDSCEYIDVNNPTWVQV